MGPGKESESGSIKREKGRDTRETPRREPGLCFPCLKRKKGKHAPRKRKKEWAEGGGRGGVHPVPTSLNLEEGKKRRKKKQLIIILKYRIGRKGRKGTNTFAQRE